MSSPEVLQAEPNDYDLISGLRDGMRPEPRLSVSEWADQHRRLSSTASAEPGKWRTSRAPYLRPIMDALSSLSPYIKVILKKGAQLGLTEAGLNWIGYIIDISPAPTLMVMPTDAMVKKNSKTRFDPMIKDTPRLSEKIKSSRERDAGNTINQKDFPGGTVIMVGANSPVGLRSMPAKNVMLDEVDAYPMDVDGEGSPIDLAEARTRTFAKKKIYILSTPTVEGRSIITSEFEDTDQNYFFVPCPHCAAVQHLQFERLRWTPKKYDTTRYICEHCEGEIEEFHKTEMLAHGEFKPLHPEKSSKTKIGFHINSLYSPLGWYSWANIAEDYEKALKDITKMKAFTNTVLGMEYKEESDAPEWERIYDRRENYAQDKPSNEVAFLTAGVDVQKDRLEVEVVGWIRGKKSQSITYRVLLGQTQETEVWQKLGAMLNETWEREDGLIMPITIMAVDTGYNTSYVHEFTRNYDSSRVIAVKGSANLGVLVSSPKPVDVLHDGKRIGSKQWNIGVNIIKTELYGWLKLRKNEDGTFPDGYCHFPQYDSHYFRGLTAEAVEQRLVKGFRKYEWVKKYERNEPLDCRVYARAAAAVFGMDRLSDEGWTELAASYGQNNNENQQRPRKKSDFWDKK